MLESDHKFNQNKEKKKDLTAKDGIKKQNEAASYECHHSPELLFPAVGESCELTVECRRSDYSASALARAVEDADAHLLNLNVTARPTSSYDRVAVDLRVNHRNGGSVARSLERYGFTVVELREGYDPDTELTRQRFAELLSHFDI